MKCHPIIRDPHSIGIVLSVLDARKFSLVCPPLVILTMTDPDIFFSKEFVAKFPCILNWSVLIKIEKREGLFKILIFVES